MTNRILVYLSSDREADRARRLSNQYRDLASEIEADAAGAVECCYPSADCIVGGDERGHQLRLLPMVDPDPIDIRQDPWAIREQVAAELRRVAERLVEAAGRIVEGGGR